MRTLLFTFAILTVLGACDRSKGKGSDIQWQQRQELQRQEEQRQEEQHYKDMIFKDLEDKHDRGIQNAGPT